MIASGGGCDTPDVMVMTTNDKTEVKALVLLGIYHHCTNIGMSDFLYVRLAKWERGSENNTC